jgi:hypothetical protein
MTLSVSLLLKENEAMAVNHKTGGEKCQREENQH